MLDHEIATKRLTDWKPETDIKLQKAFGKFVEEAGELLEASVDYVNLGNSKNTISFENEIADCQAFIEVMITASAGRLSLNPEGYSPAVPIALSGESFVAKDLFPILALYVGKTISWIGRCQIQGLNGKDPESNITNTTLLENSLYDLRTNLEVLKRRCGLDVVRILLRKQAKIDSKLPWVMGTATDLLPDKSSCDHNWRYEGTDRGGSHKGEDVYTCIKCSARKYEN